MALRTINNQGDPILKPDGTPWEGAIVKATLVDSLRYRQTWGIAPGGGAGSLIGGAEAVIDAQGFFTLELWPNDELGQVGRDEATVYRVELIAPMQAGYDAGRLIPGWTPFFGTVMASDSVLPWVEFQQSGVPLTGEELSLLLTHMADDLRHLTTDEREALTAANSPSITNPLATLADTGGGGPAVIAYEHVQATPAAQWTVNHNLGTNPVIQLYDVGGAKFDAEILHVTVNQAIVYLVAAVAGVARCL